MRVLIAPDSFKGSLTSVAVAQALARGWQRARPDDEVRIAPLADGGEGTLVAVEAAGGWQWRDAERPRPAGPADPRARGSPGTTARSRSSRWRPPPGLSLVAAGERDAARAHERGHGDVLRAVLDAGIRDISLGIGGSATTDGGAGLLRALGARGGGRPDGGGPRGPRPAARRDPAADRVRRHQPAARRATARRRPTGPQKGATPDDVPVLDARLARFADALDAATGRSERDTPGAGAAGRRRVRAAVRSPTGSRACALEPGIDLVMAVTGFDAALASADLVITGEGRVDAQTAFGKTALGVAQRARAAGTPCLADRRRRDARGDRRAGARSARSPCRSPRRRSRSRRRWPPVPGPLERCGERLARLLFVLD